jgi:Tfp pilus assembly protein PilE
MQSLKNQRGFAVIEAVLGVLLLAAIGAAGYFAYQNHHLKTTGTKAPVATPAASKTATTNPYADWKTYTSTYEQASFKYPGTWKANVQSDPSANPADGSGAENVTLTSPGGFTLVYSDSVSGLGGACPPGTPDIMLTKVQELPNAGGTSAVYLTENAGTIGLAGTSAWYNVPVGGSDTGSCLFYPLVGSKTHSDSQLGFSSAIQFVPDDQAFSSAQQKDLPTAEQILESFHF